MRVDVDGDQVVQREADDRGRVNLGTDYANVTVDVVVVKVYED